MGNFNGFAQWAKSQDPNKINWAKVKQDFPHIDVDAFIANEMSTPYDQTVKPKSELGRLVEGVKQLPRIGLGALGYLSGAEAATPREDYPLPQFTDVARETTIGVAKESLKNAVQWGKMAGMAGSGEQILALNQFGNQIVNEPITTGLRVAGVLGGAAGMVGMVGKATTLGEISAKVGRAAKIAAEAKKAEALAKFGAIPESMADIGMEERIAASQGKYVPIKEGDLDLPKGAIGGDIESPKTTNNKFMSETGAVRIPSKGDIRKVYTSLRASTADAVALKHRIPDDPAIAEFADKAINTETTARTLEGKSRIILEGAAKPNKGLEEIATNTFKSNFEKGLPQATPELQDLANRWQQVSRMFMGELRRVGAKVGEIRNYFPDVLTQDARRALIMQKGELWDAIIKQLKNENKYTQGINDAELYSRLKSMGIDNTTNFKFSSADYSRRLNLPDFVEIGGKKVAVLDTNPYTAIPRYIERMSKRIGVLENFGDDLSVIEGLKNKASNWKHRELINEHFEALQGMSSQDIQNIKFETSKLGKVLSTTESIVRLRQLSAATIQNLVGSVQSMEKYGLSNTIKAMIDPIAAKMGNIPAKERIALLHQYDAFAKDVLKGQTFAEGFQGTSQKIAHTGFKLTGMNVANRYIDMVSGGAALRSVEHGVDIIRRGEKGALKIITGGDAKTYLRQLKKDFLFSDSDIKSIVKNGLSEKQKARIVQRAPSLTNAYRESVIDRPLWMKGPIMKRVLAYQSFPRVMGNIAKDALIEARHGNMVPLTRLMAGQIVAGETIQGIRNFLLNRNHRDEEIAERLANDLLEGGTFGIPGSVWRIIKYAKTPAEAVTPPTVEGVFDIAKAGYESVKKGSIKPTVKEAVTGTPLVNMAGNAALKILNPKQAAIERAGKTAYVAKREYKPKLIDALMANDTEGIKDAFDKLHKAGVNLTNEEINSALREKYKERGATSNFWETIGVVKKK